MRIQTDSAESQGNTRVFIHLITWRNTAQHLDTITQQASVRNINNQRNGKWFTWWRCWNSFMESSRW
jgi:hypothetical protein